ncbi:helix-turn-helix domain-containing protein [Magnetospirillum sp. SS-4]|uniref:helix-turn-helix domain-containing protein n=1 Tax=Magnetospirillum sp. SS-4 TaxID=2681465 RepID=UPI001383F768|nr:helix-turn-helix transcriptional regulator [Magnetospirillum sp. SS-4]CAA7612813.1 Uncharacterized HTH-type transcriptional regulator Smed_0045 [Magnetospirillum sp. SS-4]
MARPRSPDSPPSPRKSSRRGRLPSGLPNPIDIHVGARVRLRRTLMGLSQEKLGAALGLTFQQVQKYERGANRIGASRLFDLGRVLDVPVSFFFDDMSDAIRQQSPLAVARGDAVGLAEEPAGFENDPLTRRETLDLVRAYYAIADPHIRRRVYDLAKALAASAESGKQP